MSRFALLDPDITRDLNLINTNHGISEKKKKEKKGIYPKHNYSVESHNTVDPFRTLPKEIAWTICMCLKPCEFSKLRLVTIYNVIIIQGMPSMACSH